MDLDDIVIAMWREELVLGALAVSGLAWSGYSFWLFLSSLYLLSFLDRNSNLQS